MSPSRPPWPRFELEAREYPGAYHSIAFHGANGEDIVAETTVELLPACVALIAHPDDERFPQHLFGTTVMMTSPVFGVELPVVSHPAAEIDKGAGIAMCCTFGDLTDVVWWRELSLPMRFRAGQGRPPHPRHPRIGSPPRLAAPCTKEMAGRARTFSAHQGTGLRHCRRPAR